MCKEVTDPASAREWTGSGTPSSRITMPELCPLQAPRILYTGKVLEAFANCWNKWKNVN
jgi:hypothetical protein